MTKPTACTVDVGDADPESIFDSIHVPGFEEAPTITITTTGADRRDFETIEVPDDWSPEDIGAALERARAAGRHGVTLVVGDPGRFAEGLDGLRRAIGERLLPAITVLAREMVDCLHDLRTRHRRSRQNRSRRARGARRLDIRTGKANDPRQSPPMTLTLGGRT